MDWSITEITKLTGTTSRTLRHYDQIGLLAPTRIGDNGYRYYNHAALTTLQRILLLRELGLGLDAIAQAIARQDDIRALSTHVSWLREEQHRITKQIASIEHTIRHREQKGQLMAHDMFDGFNQTAHREEVEQRWGKAAWEESSDWWASKTPSEKEDFATLSRELTTAWTEAWTSGDTADSAVAQELARRQYDWLSGIPGTPQSPDGGPTREYYLGLGDMYVADDRFAANYGGTSGAALVRDAMRLWAKRNF
jgi:MerR family transcriptional regulator, thiopeptide resistance regulator